MRPQRFAIAAVTLGLASGAVGCAGESTVMRVYDGRLVEGGFVPPEAYAAYLKGVLAEEAGDLRSALAAYEEATREDDEDPEPFTRIGDVRCKLDPKSKAADDAFSRALRIDPTYAPALEARAGCALARGQAKDGLAAIDQVAQEDRIAVSTEALFVRLAAQRSDSAADRPARERAIALTVASGERPAAWDALVAWGRAKTDPDLLARGLEGLARVAPTRSAEVEAGAVELLGAGQTALARRVAGAIADLPESLGAVGPRDPTVARLSIDDAILAGDAARAERRATRGHVALAEVAARALLLERPDLAGSIARRVLAADPSAGCAAMVLGSIAAREGRPVAALDRRTAAPSDRPAAACVLAFAERLASVNVESARAWIARVGPAPLAPHDPLAGPLAVDLAVRGVVTETALPAELRLELAARRREPPPAAVSAALEKRLVDAKHALLLHVLVDPTGAPARALLAKLLPSAERDPIVGFALARAALASLQGPTTGDAWAPARRAIAAAPMDPLVAAVGLELARRGGRAEDVPPARARLMAIARTPAERALAKDAKD